MEPTLKEYICEEFKTALKQCNFPLMQDPKLNVVRDVKGISTMTDYYDTDCLIIILFSFFHSQVYITSQWILQKANLSFS